ncbi:MAG: tRNA guanosine(34) transglycosylase Tgt [Oscillospiraceae bacterium]|nr:tRNA guanosine(34) transglycosylase Tgt [Oscillospiraceae bacterium]
MNNFTLLSQDKNARRGAFITAHGAIQTPFFMNVATQAAIKGGLSAYDLEQVGCQVALCNAYHLHLRPSEKIIKDLGGLHGFMNWQKPILTDSGGFQVFSLAGLRKITEGGVTFNSHIDGRKIFMGPEESIDIQMDLGADIIMAFDECVGNPATREYVAQSCRRTTRWLERCKTRWSEHAGDTHQDVSQNTMLFGINQGGTYDDLRIDHMKTIAEFNLPGYAIGGLAVGEPAEVMYHIIETVMPYMPVNKPRYLMGVGTPCNLIEAVARGIDMFDCVMPARNGRHGHVQTWQGRMNLRNEKYKLDASPIEGNCQCFVCQTHSRAYLRHLLVSGEMLGMRLCAAHNLYFYNHLMARMRAEIESGTFEKFRRQYVPLLDERI